MELAAARAGAQRDVRLAAWGQRPPSLTSWVPPPARHFSSYLLFSGIQVPSIILMCPTALKLKFPQDM